MTEKHGDEKLEEMSDGALRKAIQALQNAQGSIEYAIKMMPEDEWDDLDAVDGPAKDAHSRVGQQLEMLFCEWNSRSEND